MAQVAEEMVTLTTAMFDAARTEYGGWTQAQLHVLGVSRRPKPGWKQRLIGQQIPRKLYDEFMAARSIVAKRTVRAREDKRLGKKASPVPVATTSGTSKAELIKLRTDAMEAIDGAMRALVFMAPDGRDYQGDERSFKVAKNRNAEWRANLRRIYQTIEAETLLIDSEE